MNLHRMRNIFILVVAIHLGIHEAFCSLKSCSSEKIANKVCQNGNSQTLPRELHTFLILREIVDINEEKRTTRTCLTPIILDSTKLFDCQETRTVISGSFTCSVQREMS